MSDEANIPKSKSMSSVVSSYFSSSSSTTFFAGFSVVVLTGSSTFGFASWKLEVLAGPSAVGFAPWVKLDLEVRSAMEFVADVIILESVLDFKLVECVRPSAFFLHSLFQTFGDKKKSSNL